MSAGAAVRAVVVVPCYNEEVRLDVAAFAGAASAGRLEFLFVDDGSTDGTARLIANAQEAAPGFHLHRMPRNAGKAEAVREGLRLAIERNPTHVGYFDADLAAPISELQRAIDLVETDPEIRALLGARVALLGRSIERSRARHYQGRVFASIASLALDLAVYDTQCGLKLFRNDEVLADVLSTPFRSRWAFDVELLGRLLEADPRLRTDGLYEMPLRTWSDIDGSSLSIAQRARTLADLLMISAPLAKHRTHRSCRADSPMRE